MLLASSHFVNPHADERILAPMPRSRRSSDAIAIACSATQTSPPRVRRVSIPAAALPQPTIDDLLAATDQLLASFASCASLISTIPASSILRSRSAPPKRARLARRVKASGRCRFMSTHKLLSFSIEPTRHSFLRPPFTHRPTLSPGSHTPQLVQVAPEPEPPADLEDDPRFVDISALRKPREATRRFHAKGNVFAGDEYRLVAMGTTNALRTGLGYWAPR